MSLNGGRSTNGTIFHDLHHEEKEISFLRDRSRKFNFFHNIHYGEKQTHCSMEVIVLRQLLLEVNIF